MAATVRDVFTAVGFYFRESFGGGDVLIASRIYREPKGASPVLGFTCSLGKKTQRIEIRNSKVLRFAIQLIAGALETGVRQGKFNNDPEWRVLRVKEGDGGKEERVLVSVTSLARRLDTSKEIILMASNQNGLERLISGYAGSVI